MNKQLYDNVIRLQGNSYYNGNIFLNVPNIGRLVYSDILLSCVEPKIFVCKNERGEQYILHEISNIKSIYTWIMAKVNGDAIAKIKDGKIPVQEAFLNDNNNFVLSKNYNYDGGTIISKNCSLAKTKLFSMPEFLYK